MTPLSGNQRELPKPEYFDALQQFRELMPHRIQRMLLVGSQYDFFLLWEDGQLSQLLLSEWLHVQLNDTSWITAVFTSEEALEACRQQNFDLVVVTPHIRDTGAVEMGRMLLTEHPELAVVPIAFDDHELAELRKHEEIARFERPFLWQGDFRLLAGIVQSIEDRRNVAADTESVGVSVIILIEDSVHYYSSYLPVIYATLTRQSQRVISEGTNLHHKVMRLRARPKIIHCISFEEALDYFNRYRGSLLGIISDINFPRAGRTDAGAGLDFVRIVRSILPDLPVLLQTNDPGLVARAESLHAAVVLKKSPTLLEEVGRFMRDNFGFGNFIFTDDNGTVIGEAAGLRVLEGLLNSVPDHVMLRHAERNHFSTWLRARTEFGLAEALRGVKVSDFESADEVRAYLVGAIRDFRRSRQGGHVAEFNAFEFNPAMSFARIGEGSLGGKARGLGFVRSLLRNYQLRTPFPATDIFVPSALVLATDVFDRFLEANSLLDFAIQEQDDAILEQRFIAAQLPEDIFQNLLEFIDIVKYPLAVRSSSLLEDSQNFSLTGVYRTYMVPNSHPDRQVRVKQLVNAIKRVYASTFRLCVKECFRPSPYRLEEEKMAVIIQRVVGSAHESRFYPDFSGTLRSHNFYPVAPMKAEDGIAQVALGLGEAVAEGGRALSFCPRYPRKPINFSSPEDILKNSQTEFYALDLEDSASHPDPTRELCLSKYGLEVAKKDGKLRLIGSTYSPDNRVVYDGVARPGVLVVSFTAILKRNMFPLARILQTLMEIGSQAMNMPVEIEFAVNLSVPEGGKWEFAFLQLRPCALASESVELDLEEIDPERILCSSTQVLGSGRIETLRDIIVVDREGYDRSRSAEVAQQVSEFNSKMLAERTPYLLIGVGRFGSADPWLGIPVIWPQIAGARVIIEADFKDMATMPSQGSHFFQNITASGVGYFTVGGIERVGRLDWDWLAAQPAVRRSEFVRHVRLERPLTVMMDGHKGHGAVLHDHTANHDPD